MAPVLASGALCAVLLLVACGEDAGSDPDRGRALGRGGVAAGGAGGRAGPPGEAPTELRWQTLRPHTSLMLVGNLRGAFRPAPAPKPRVGGLERLATLADVLRHRADRVFAVVSLGWSMRGSGEPQEESEANLYRAALRLLGGEASVLGAPDVLVPAMSQPLQGGGEADLPRAPVNLPLPPGFASPLSAAAERGPFAEFAAGDLAVLVASALDPDHAPELRGAGIAPTAYAPNAALGAITPRPTALWIVSTDAGGDALTGLVDAMRRLGPSVIVHVGGEGVSVVEGRPLIGEPVVVSLGESGREVGVLDLDAAAEGRGWTVSYHTVRLLPALDDYPSELRGRVRRLLKHYQRDVRERGWLARFPNLPDEQEVAYVGSGRCAACHPGIYQDWLNSGHANGLRTLEAEGAQWDPSCVRCHVVGFERTGSGRWQRARSGFQDPVRTPHLGGVGCEGCHGPGSSHVAAPEDRTVWARGFPAVARPGRGTCLVCHDAESSPGFAARFEALLEQVDHRRVPSDRRTVPPR